MTHRGAATPSPRILQRVREDATDLALLATTTSHDWKLVSDKNGTALYEMTGESLSPRVSTVRTFGKGGGGHASEFYLVRAATTVRADVNALLDALRTSSSEDFRALMKRLFDRQFENGAVVDSLTCTTPPPFAPSPDTHGSSTNWQLFSEDDGYSANWLTLRAFSKLGNLEGHRDFTMVCYQDVFERSTLSDRLERVGRRAARDPQRRRPAQGAKLLGVHTFSSMNFKDLPELPKSSKTDRLHLRNSGVVVEELEADADGPAVRVSVLLSLMPSKLVLRESTQSPRMRVAQAAGGEVHKKFRKWLQTLAQGVGHLAQAAKPAVTMQHLGKMTWTESDHCFLCLKTFRTYRRRHHCRFCGEAVCGSCSAMVNMAAFDVNYQGHAAASPDSISVGHRRLDLRSASDGSENASPNRANGSGSSSEEFMEARGCTTCVSELQMNLTMAEHAKRGQQTGSLYSSSSSGSLTQLMNARAQHESRESRERRDPDRFDHDSMASSRSGASRRAPPAYRSLDDSSVDRATPLRSDYAQYAGQKTSFSTISSSSYSGLSHDERAQLALYSSTSSAEFMGRPPALSSISQDSNSTQRGRLDGPHGAPSVVSDARLSTFLARDQDILSLSGLTLSPRGSSIAPSMFNGTVLDDDEHMDLDLKRVDKRRGSGLSDGHLSCATTAATTEGGSNHSQFRFANMTADEAQQAAHAIYLQQQKRSVQASGRPPRGASRAPAPSRPAYQPQYQPQYASPVHSSHSSGSEHSDLIQLSSQPPVAKPSASTTSSSASQPQSDFVLFTENRQTQLLSRHDSAQDMIPLQF